MNLLCPLPDLNQYTQRDIPRYLDVGGEADAAATVTVAGEAAARQGRYFYRELDRTSEGNGATLEEVTITATLPPAQGETAERIGEIEREALLLAHPESFGYDGDGNLTHDGRWVYTWNAENRLITMETSTQALQAGVPRQKLAFTYDSQGRRVGKTVYAWNESVGYEVVEERIFLYDGWNLVHEVRNPDSAEETSVSYVWGTDVSGTFQGAGGVGGLLITVHEGGTAYAPVYEGGKNIVGYHDADTGETVAEFAYGAFGEPLRARVGVEAELPFRYSTKYTEAESGLLYYGYRFYDPETGRWLSRDPIGEEGGVNLYGFVGNDGVNVWDLLGLSEPCPTDCDYLRALLLNAFLAKAGYTGDIPSSTGFKEVEGSLFVDEGSGFMARRFKRNNPLTAKEEEVMVFAGTDVFDLHGDWNANARQFMNLHSEQHALASDLSTSIHGRNVDWFVGHSLGGGLAHVAARSTGNPAVTFNAASLSGNSLLLYGGNISNFNVNNFHTESDLLTTSQPELEKVLGQPKHSSGENYIIPNPRKRKIFEGKKVFGAKMHMMDSVIESIEGMIDEYCK